MFQLEVRRPFDGHRSADDGVGLGDLLASETERAEQIKAWSFQLLLPKAETLAQEIVAQRPAVEDKRQLERARQQRVDLLQDVVGKALGLKRVRVDVRRPLQQA